MMPSGVSGGKMLHPPAVALIALLSASIAAGSTAALPTRAQDQTPTPTEEGEIVAELDSPTARSVVSGIVTITGTAIAPGFRFYLLEYNIDPTPSNAPWTPIQAPVSQQARHSVLGAWDTESLADGRYIIRLTVVYGEARQAAEAQVQVQVSNATATPHPLPPTSTPSPAPGTPTPGPSPTPLIQQPPTRTPRPPEAPTRIGTGAAPGASPESPLAPDRLKQAAWRGVLLALGGFGLFGAYSLVRAARRGQLRQGWRDFQREVINPLGDLLGRRRTKGR